MSAEPNRIASSPEPGRSRFEIGRTPDWYPNWDDLEPWAKAYWAEVERLEAASVKRA